MAEQTSVDRLRRGVKTWNHWRWRHPQTSPDVSYADLGGANLSGVYLNNTNLSGANLSSASLIEANLSSANLDGADLSNTYCNHKMYPALPSPISQNGTKQFVSGATSLDSPESISMFRADFVSFVSKVVLMRTQFTIWIHYSTLAILSQGLLRLF